VPAQALLLLNNEFVQQSAARWAKAAQGQTDPVSWLYESGFGRAPLAGEREQIAQYLGAHSWDSLCHVLLNSAEFLYVE